MDNIVQTLFSTYPMTVVAVSKELGGILIFTEGQLYQSVKSLRNRKAPGQDDIPSEVLKVVAKQNSCLLL